MQIIHLITTGGTIEKIYSEQLGTVRNATSKIRQNLEKLRLPDCEVRILPLMNIDSLEMSADDRATLVSKLTELLACEEPIIITHGTDTMVETGLYIMRAFPDLCTAVILTGAMTPLGFENSDGLQNLTESLFAARLLEPGVYVVIHNQVFPIDHVRKDKELATFVAI